MKFEDMNWKGVEEYLKKDQRVMLVLGLVNNTVT